MTDDEAIDRIGKLLKLATNNPNEAEARSAAFQAVTLIAKHGLVVGRPVAVRQWHAPSPDYDFADYLRMEQERMTRDANAYRSPFEQTVAEGHTPGGGSWWVKFTR